MWMPRGKGRTAGQPHIPSQGPSTQGRRSTATDAPAGRGWVPRPAAAPAHPRSPSGQRKESAPTELQLHGGDAAALRLGGRQGRGLPQWPPPWRCPPAGRSAPSFADGPLPPPSLSLLLLRAEPAGRQRPRTLRPGSRGKTDLPRGYRPSSASPSRRSPRRALGRASVSSRCCSIIV